VVVILGSSVVVGVYLAWAWRRAHEDSKRLINGIWRLPVRAKLRLAWMLARDRRVPLWVRLLPPALVIYLAMPLDLVPDFIPVLGQLDDILVSAVGVALLLHFVPRAVLEEALVEAGSG
jgi:uncharacterized membrane protein YkvA (DUF1232 family)